MEVLSLIDLLDRAAAEAGGHGYTFLTAESGVISESGESSSVAQPERLTYAELQSRSHTVAGEFAALMMPGSRAVFVYPPGLSFIEAFFGALRAGVVPVPMSPPIGADLAGWTEHLERIIAEAKPDAIVTTQEFLDLKQALELDIGPPGLSWVATDSFAGGHHAGWSSTSALPLVRPDDIAFLQFTSGSTSRPKGVVLRHENLLANERALAPAFGLDRCSIVVSWLPVFHDMGLIGCVLHPMFQGCDCYLMSPLDFLQRPARWLQAISRFRATCSGGPNFAYDLCVKRVSDEERATLDLSSWRVAFNGAESVRAATLAKFAEVFGPVGFSPDSAVPCYGLAEASLFVSGHRPGKPNRVLRVERGPLAEGAVVLAAPDSTAAVEVVSVGGPSEDHEVVVVDGAERAEAGSVGEIWVKGPSVASGYWRQSTESEATFGNHLASGDGPYLRTGDLGFVWDGELYVSGRSKEVMIVRGRNVFPHDLEDVVQRADGRFRPGCGAAFAIEGPDGDVVVLVQETAETAPGELDGLIALARRLVSERFQVALAAVALVEARSVPKTSSGKLQRLRCRQLFLERSLSVVAEWNPAAGPWQEVPRGRQ